MTAMPPIAVIAGGLATRMYPVTASVPKSMLDVAGEPFIAHQLRLFRREGLERVVLCIGHLGEMIEAFVGDGRRFGLSVAYSRDGERLMGTGGALRRALPSLGDEFLVTYGDSYLDIAVRPIVDAFHRAGLPALMTVFHNQGRWDTSNVEFADGRILAYSKQPTARMAHIDFGLSMLQAEVLAAMPQGEPFDLAAVYRALVETGRMAGCEVATRFYEIGSPAGLIETAAYIKGRDRGDEEPRIESPS